MGSLCKAEDDVSDAGFDQGATDKDDPADDTPVAGFYDIQGDRDEPRTAQCSLA